MRKWPRTAMTALAAGGAVLALTGQAMAAKPTSYLKGDVNEGEYYIELTRGALVPDELTVLPTGDDCNAKLEARITWNKQQNWVKLHLKGKNALEQYPSVDRTEGVNYWPNPFWPEPEDYDNGRHQFWFIMLAEPTPFYYDIETLDLIGSIQQVGTPPVGSIELHLPVGHALATDFFQPNEKGDVDFVQTFAYDKMVRGDLPEIAHIKASYIPHNLCTAHPFRYEQTSTRPWGVAMPAEDAHSWEDYLRGGMFFDVTVEPPEYHVYPPLTSSVATFSQVPAAGGGVPEGWTLDIEAVFANLAPPIRPWPGAGACEPWTRPKRDRDFNQCIGGGH